VFRRDAAGRKSRNRNPGRETGFSPAAVGDALRQPRLARNQPEGTVRRKGTAREVLAVGAVACVDQLRFFRDLVTNLAAQAAAGLWKFHGDAFRRMKCGSLVAATQRDKELANRAFRPCE